MTTLDPSRPDAVQDLGDDRSSRAFERLAEPLRREIRLHCYRMLGAFHEAEDAVQETFLRAWKGFARFEGAAFRAWLYRIATNVCLDTLARRKQARRVLPDQMGPAADGPPGAPAMDVAWLEPLPDREIEGVADAAPDPEARYSARESVALAFVAAIQQLPPRQRAALMLCDVLGWASAEAANLLDASTASINSALQRARETLSKSYPEGRVRTHKPSAEQEALLGKYLRAWEGHDLDGFVALLREDAAVIMPPWLEWYVGRAVIGAFFDGAWKTCGGLRLVPTAANGQPAFAVYERNAEGAYAAHSIHVLTLEGGAIATMTLFLEPRLFASFELPEVLPR